MEDLGTHLQQLFGIILIPGHWLMGTLGLAHSDIQVWALMVGIFMLVLGCASASVDIALLRRQVPVTGTIVGIDGNDYDSPRIAFTDHRGRPFEFDSNLPTRLGADAVGDAIEVVYDPLNPRRAREAGRAFHKLAGIVVWFGTAAMTLAFAFSILPS